MLNNAQKVEQSTQLNKALNYGKIIETIGKEFNLQLERAKLYYKASENFKLLETKEELKKLNIDFKDKYQYFLECFGTAKSQTSRLIKVGGAEPEKIKEYRDMELEPLRNSLEYINASDADRLKMEKKVTCSIDRLFAFLGDKKDNSTTTAPTTTTTTTEKPAKFSTAKKGIDIKINSGVTAEDIAEAIAYLQSLQK